MLDFTQQTSDGAIVACTATGASAPVVLLHPGVGDRRIWSGVMEAQGPGLAMLAYDRPGFGTTAPASAPYSHLQQLHEVITAHAAPPVVLVGNSQGGQIALDYTLAYPGYVRALILIGAAISGWPYGEDDATVAALEESAFAAWQSGDLESANRIEAHLWLDGPYGPPHRVHDVSRVLFRRMNAIPLSNPWTVEAQPVLRPAWDRLEEVRVPTTIVTGELDVRRLNELNREAAARIPNARLIEWAGVAHLPALEDPRRVAELITEVHGLSG